MPKIRQTLIDCKLQQIMDQEGFDDQLEFGEHYINEGCVPGICMNEDCDDVYHYEPDNSEGWCESCEANTVQSAFILMGVI